MNTLFQVGLKLNNASN